jgi:hypothetical protein
MIIAWKAFRYIEQKYRPLLSRRSRHTANSGQHVARRSNWRRWRHERLDEDSTARRQADLPRGTAGRGELATSAARVASLSGGFRLLYTAAGSSLPRALKVAYTRLNTFLTTRSRACRSTGDDDGRTCGLRAPDIAEYRSRSMSCFKYRQKCNALS